MSSGNFKVFQTKKFSTLDLPEVKVNAHQKPVQHPVISNSHKDNARANKESGERIKTEDGGLLIDPSTFHVHPNPHYIKEREEVFNRLLAKSQAELASQPDIAITITLPSGETKQGLAFKTTPYDIAKSISQGLADSVVVAALVYSKKYEEDNIVACDEDEEEQSQVEQANSEQVLWDMNRPFIGDCTMRLLKFDDPEAKTVFWHSSAHVLGSALENLFGCHLTIGPPLTQGFYYDSYIGSNSIAEEDLKKINDKTGEICKAKHVFQRLKITKAEALELFAANPFKVQLITNKIPDGGFTTVYKCGPLIDLCMGPHLPNTGKIKAFQTLKTSSTNWLGKVTNDPLQRIYAISFPDKAQLKNWLELQEKAKQRDHRILGGKQELFFFHNLSPGSAFWLPHGARVYNKLQDFIKAQYWKRGYTEVITPNIFNLALWEQSGHAAHYKENMFVFEVEGQEWGMKPMNCPAHCLMFGHRLRSYRELPLRLADFGALHRNELSGALTGLTRVRRFQQDDAHIFCRQDQIKQEVLGALDFMRFVYGVFGMTYKLELSTKPAKALGDDSLWEIAESQLAAALDEFAGSGNWRVNPGDGAFYGPKIDIKVFDAMERVHQCATVQLDFQLPIRFNLEYKAAGGETEAAFERPVMVHRAMLGSVERMAAVLTEHYGGKWPLWLSPRQLVVIPVDLKFADYAIKVQQAMHDAGFYVDIDESHHTLNKKIREAQLAQYNYILVVGQVEMDSNSVNIRSRENEVQGTLTIEAAVKKFTDLVNEYK